MNQAAFLAGKARTLYEYAGLEWNVVTAPYRVYCLSQLQNRFQKLGSEDQKLCGEFLGQSAVEILKEKLQCQEGFRHVSASDLSGLGQDGTVARLWQKKDATETFVGNVLRTRETQSVAECKQDKVWLPLYFRQHRAGR